MDEQNPDFFSNYVNDLPPHVHRILATLKAKEIDTDYLANALNSGKVTIATDGSVRGGNGSYTILLNTSNKSLRLQDFVHGHISLLF